MKDRIRKVVGREILNAKGRPTVEAELVTEGGIRTVASVPVGTSRGKYEACDLYDGGERYRGLGVRTAVAHVSGCISDALAGSDVTDQQAIDCILLELDGTENKSRLGANAILATSVAAAKAGAAASGLEPYAYLCPGRTAYRIPDIVATVIAGGVFSTSGLEFEDYMLILRDFGEYPRALEALCAMRGLLEKRLAKRYGIFPEDGGALAPPCASSAEAFAEMLETADRLGYSKNVTLGLDVAASELYEPETGMYRLSNGRKLAAGELLDYYVSLCQDYPLTFIEDGFEQDRFEDFSRLTARLPGIQTVGDDLFVTNPARLKRGIAAKAANGLLMKVNQIGTVTEAIAAAQLAQENDMDVIVSLRSGETTDDFIADLAVAVGARQIKLGSPVRAERIAKYNRLLKIWDHLSQGGK